MIFDKLHHMFRIRILQKVSYSYGSGSTTLMSVFFLYKIYFNVGTGISINFNSSYYCVVTWYKREVSGNGSR
jgi:hypothetical protein